MATAAPIEIARPTAPIATEVETATIVAVIFDVSLAAMSTSAALPCVASTLS